MSSKIVLLLALAVLLLPVPPADAQMFRADDPISVDRDDLPIARPARRKINDYYDFFENTFGKPGDRTPRRAMNINTLGEVPDSSWFTNRIGVRAISRDDLVRGANQGSGPVAPYTIIGGKTQGITPGFTIRDGTGEVYFIKFDPMSNPELATAAEMITSRFFYAAGYNTAEYFLIRFKPSEMPIADNATVRNELDEEIRLTSTFVESLLATVSRAPDGTIRAIASKRIPGTGIGPFKFFGTRADDPNDIFPHEHRRELRGYNVISAWLNHDDSRSINTYDSYVGDAGKGSVKHYLLDFGSTLGSGSVAAQKRRPGNEYLWEPRPTFIRMFTFGLWLPQWVSVKYPKYPAVGRIEAEYFRPEKWKPEYPNAAFYEMDAEDAFWATRLVLKFRDEDIRAVIPVGQISDRQAADYLAGVLIQRRDKIGNYWLRQTSSLDEFRIQGSALVFEDLLTKYGFETGVREYTSRIAAFNNQSGARTDLGAAVPVRESRVALPDSVGNAANGSFFVVTIAGSGHSVDVFLKRADNTLKIVGIQRT